MCTVENLQVCFGTRAYVSFDKSHEGTQSDHISPLKMALLAFLLMIKIEWEWEQKQSNLASVKNT